MRSLKTLLAAGAAALSLGLSAVAVMAADEKVKLVYSDTVPENDSRTTVLREAFGKCLGDGFEFQSYHGATLFKQGTELTAIQRGNLDMASLAIYDFQNQVPSSSILGAGYLFRDYAHMRAVHNSGVLNDLWKEIEDKAQVVVLANPYIGTRQLNLKGEKIIKTPADMEGVKLRMPGGEGWQFIGKALGGNPTPMAYTEVYTGLQTGAIDAQDNPAAAAIAMKFYEVTDQLVLTNHLVAANEFVIGKAKWDGMTQPQRQKISDCARFFEMKLDEDMLRRDSTALDDLKAKGIKVYDPDRDAFRKHAQEMYLKSPLSESWPKGLLEKINGL